MRGNLEALSTAARCACLAIALGACNAKPPGELVGVYSITGELTENTCGRAALPAPDPLEFDVEIRRLADERALWIQGSPPGSTGSLDGQGDFEFVSQGTFDVNPPEPRGSSDLLEMDPLTLANLDTFETFEAAPAADAAPCVLGVSELARGSLRRDAQSAADAGMVGEDGGDGDPDLVGENEIAIRVASGDCALVLTAEGGVFDRLPCRAHYALAGRLGGE